MENNNEDRLLQESLHRMKREKMDWDFDDFLEKAEAAEGKETLPPARGRYRFRIASLAVAALLVLLFGIFFIIKYMSGKSGGTSDLVKNEIIKQKKAGKLADTLNVSGKTFAVNDTIKKQDTLEIRSEKKAENDDESAVLNKILPRRGRLRKPRKALLVENISVEKISAQPDSTGYIAGYVTVNGKKIDDKTEAIKIARGALNMMSASLSKTFTEVDFQDDPGN